MKEAGRAAYVWLLLQLAVGTAGALSTVHLIILTQQAHHREGSGELELRPGSTLQIYLSDDIYVSNIPAA